MNEPSNFVDGSDNGCTTNSLDNPPFTPRMFFNFIREITIDINRCIWWKSNCCNCMYICSTVFVITL